MVPTMKINSGYAVTVQQARLHGDLYAYQPCFLIDDPSGNKVGRVYLVLTGIAASILGARGIDTDGLHDAIMRYGLGRLEKELSAPGGVRALFSEGTGPQWTITGDDVDDLVTSTIADKECSYRHAEGRDYYCAASSQADSDRVGVAGIRVLAPTSVPICNECALPDDRTLCSDLSHPVVLGAAGARHFTAALCNAGRPEIDQDASECRAGGHGCWRRTIAVQAVPQAPSPAPLSLPEALDFLDALWRLAYGKRTRLIEPLTFADPAGLAREAATGEEFEACISDLADSLDRITVDRALLEEKEVDLENVQGSLNRFREFLKTDERIDGEVVTQAIETLQALRRLRVSHQHSGSASDRPRYLRELGLSDVATDWPHLWDAVRAKAVDALLILRSQVRRLTEEREAGG